MTVESKFLRKADPILDEIISKIPPPENAGSKNIFHDLMSCVIEQQIHYRSTKKTFQKMLDRSNLEVLHPDNFSLFEEKAFEDIKLSTKKYETISNIVDYWKNNNTNWEYSTEEEIRAELSKIKGIGKWTIDMILIYTLQRPDVFSFDDYHIKQQMVALYGLNPISKLKAQMIEVSNLWSPYKSTAFLYLLEWKKFKKSSLVN